MFNNALARRLEATGAEQGRQFTVTGGGMIYLDGVEADLITLEATVAHWPRDTLVQVAVDRQAAFEHFVAVLDLLRFNQLARLHMVKCQGE